MRYLSLFSFTLLSLFLMGCKDETNTSILSENTESQELRVSSLGDIEMNLSSTYASEIQTGKNAYQTANYAIALKEFQTLAQQGDAKAQAYLGAMYDEGYGVQKDYVKAYQWYRQAAEKRDPDAQKSLGDMYRLGKGTPINDEEANNWYKQAIKSYKQLVKKKDLDAQANLAQMYELGLGLSVNYKKAFELYTKSAEQGQANAQYALAKSYQYGIRHEVPRDSEQAFYWMKQAADQGHLFAQSELGIMYDIGEGTEENDQEAVKWYKKAAEKNYPEAQLNLSYMYEKGTGVPQDDKEAEKWSKLSEENISPLITNKKLISLYRLATEENNADAQFELGNIYADGDGVIKNNDEFLIWNQKALDKDHIAAQAQLGYMYEKGILEYDKDDVKAIQLYKKAANFTVDANKIKLPEINYALEKNFIIWAQYRLGDLYKEGSHGLDKDIAKAIKYYEKAANQGHAFSQYKLGELYNDPSSTFYNEKTTKYWNKIAFNNLGFEFDAEGRYYLGRLCEQGFIWDDGLETAVRYYREAMARGPLEFATKAKAKMAEFYYEGKGVEQNYVLSYVWLEISIMDGNTDIELKSKLKEKLTAQDMEKIPALIEQCRNNKNNCPK